MTNLEKLYIKKAWAEIEKQAVLGSGVHLTVEAHEDGFYCSSHLSRFGRFYGRRMVFNFEDDNIKSVVGMVMQVSLNTKRATREELKKYVNR